MLEFETCIYPVERRAIISNGPEWLLYSDQANAMLRMDAQDKQVAEALDRPLTLLEWVLRVAKAQDVSDDEALVRVHAMLGRMERAGFVAQGAAPKPVDWVSRLVTSDGKGSKTCYLSLTDKCNLTCSYCYNEDERAASLACAADQLSDDELRDLIDRLAKAGFDYMVFTGGEPMLRKSIFDLAEYANRRGVGVNLLTNGMVFTEKNVNRIIQAFESVTVSLDSAIAEEHDVVRGAGSWARIVKGLDLLYGAGAVRVALRPVVTTHNVDNIHLFPGFAYARWGTTSFQPTLYLPNSETEVKELALLPSAQRYREAMERFSEELRKIPGAAEADPLKSVTFGGRCGMADTTISVSASGDVYPCQSLHYDALRMGNVRTHSVDALFEKGRALGIIGASGLDIDACRRCAFIMICGGGCRASAYKVYDRMHAHNRMLCGHLRASAESQLRGFARFSARRREVESAGV